MGLGSITNFNNVSFGIVPSSIPDSDSLSSDKPSTLNFIDKVDKFTSSGSQSPLEQMENQLKDYESVMNINDLKQVAFLKDSKAMLAEMRSNVEAGKASLKEINKFILDSGFIQDISERVKTMSKLRVDWFALTGATQIIDFKKVTTGGFNSQIEATQDQAIQSLENTSPKAVESVKSQHNEANSLSPLESASAAKKTANAMTGLSIVKLKESFTDEIKDLQERLKNLNLTDTERRFYEQRIEKIEKAIEQLKKTDQDEIWSKLSPQQQQSILEDFKDGELTEESLQALNIATAAADKTGTINEGFSALIEQGMEKMTGMTHKKYYETYKVQMNLDSTFIKTNDYSSTDSSSSKNDSKDSNLSPDERAANRILELQSRGELSPAEQNLNNKDIAQKLGLKPDHPIVLAIAAGNYDLAQKLSVGLTVATSVNAIATATTDNQDLSEWLSFSNSVKPTDENNLKNEFLGLSFA
jgi:hypothetical protein